MKIPKAKKSPLAILWSFIVMALGAVLAAFSIEVFFVPNNLFDGGIVGLAMIAGNLVHKGMTPLFLLCFNLPFIALAYRSIGKIFVINMLVANLLFAGSMFVIHHHFPYAFTGDSLEVVVIGGAILGIGIGLIIRCGGCMDGTEILGIIINRKLGLTVGQVVLTCNFFVFCCAGVIFQDWHPPILSLITFMVAVKVMDAVIVGLDETKSVLIISSKSKQISDAIVEKLGLGFTVMYGRGGFSGNERELLYVICERLQLAELKELVHMVDARAFIAIENLHEVAGGQQDGSRYRSKNLIKRLVSKIIQR